VVDPSLWGIDRNAAGALVVGGCDLVALAERHGTPLHVVDTDALRGAVRAFRDAFTQRYANSRLFCSYKTNCVPGVIRVLHEEGCGAEVVSPFELWLAQALDVAPADVVYNGVTKADDHLRDAVQRNVGLINADSIAEIRRLDAITRELGRPVDLGIRLAPGIGWTAQFGIPIGDPALDDALKDVADNPHLTLRCLHAHFGSSVSEPQTYAKAIGRLCEAAAATREAFGFEIDRIDVGGGFSVPTVRMLSVIELAQYRLLRRPPRPPRPEAAPSPVDFAAAITDALRAACARHGLREPMLLLEPGRALTSSAQLLVVRVGDIKPRDDRSRYAVTDGSMQQQAYPLSYEYHHCLLANRTTAAADRRYFVTGPLCSPEDLLYRNWPLPELRVGDLLAIMDAGAYFTSFENDFSFPRPPVVLASDGKHEVVRERETFRQMVARDGI
jgi:diaminopimelate decarboxylase